MRNRRFLDAEDTKKVSDQVTADAFNVKDTTSVINVLPVFQ